MSFPTTIGPEQVLVRSVTPTLVSTSHNLTTRTRSKGAQRWELELSYNGLTREEIAPIYSFCISQRGRHNSFTYIPPATISDTAGSCSGATVSGGGQTGRSLSVASLNGTLKAGDFFTIAGDAKVYMLTADKAASSTTLAFEPALRVSPSNGAAITVNSVPFTCRLSSDIAELGIGAPSIQSFSVQLEEALYVQP